jgi:hypothetical protein
LKGRYRDIIKVCVKGLRKTTKKVRMADVLTENKSRHYSYTSQFGGTRWRWVVSFISRPLYPQRKILQYPLDRGQGTKRAEKYLPLQEIEP